MLTVPQSRRTLALLVALAATAVYINALWNGFALDDAFIVLRNPRVHQLSDVSRLVLTPYWPFFGQELGLYRPTIILLFALQWAAGDGAPWVFHATNLVFHATASILVFFLLERLSAGVPAFVGALLFAVHPVHTEAVANIVGQAELVAAIAVLAACLIHTGRPAGVAVSWPRRISLLGLFFVAISTKESTVVLPALLIVLDLVQRRVQLGTPGLVDYGRAMFMPLFLLAAGLACYLLLRLHVLGSITGIDAAPAMPYLREDYRVLNALRAFPEFLRLLLFPLDLAADYSPATILPVEEVRPLVMFGALQLAIVTGIALLTPWWPRIGFPAAWFLLTMLTVSNLFFPIGVLVAERTLYLPSAAVSALLAFAWHAAAPRVSLSMRRLAPAALVLVLIGFGVRTWFRNPDWKDTSAVGRSLFRDHPESYRAQWVHGAFLLQIPGARDAARDHYHLAYRIYDRDARFLAEYADVLMNEGNYADAIPVLERAYPITGDVNPYSQETAVQLAYAYVATGRYREALRLLDRADRISRVSTTMILRAYAHAGLAEHERAVAAWRVAAALPGYAPGDVRALLARALAHAGLNHAAAATFDSVHQRTTDPAALARIAGARRALDAGCYAPSAARDRALAAGYARARTADCDPLREILPFTPPAQNATSLQNATSGAVVRPGPSGGVGR